MMKRTYFDRKNFARERTALADDFEWSASEIGQVTARLFSWKASATGY